VNTAISRKHWRLLAVNLGSSVVEALSEGGTLAVALMGAGCSDWDKPGLASP
jgi:hypothetical protein